MENLEIIKIILHNQYQKNDYYQNDSLFVELILFLFNGNNNYDASEKHKLATIIYECLKPNDSCTLDEHLECLVFAK